MNASSQSHFLKQLVHFVAPHMPPRGLMCEKALK